MLPKILADDVYEKTVDDLNAVQKILEGETFKPAYVSTALDQIDVLQNGTLEAEGRQMLYVQGVHEDLARASGIPLSFGYSIPFELFRYNFNALKKRNSKGLTLCLVRDTVVGIGPAGYQPARTADVLDRLNLNEQVWKCNKATLCDFGTKVDLIIPNTTIEPQESDVIQVGVRISNSETGGEALRATLYTLRLACTNGAVYRNDQTVVYWKKFQKRTYDSSLKAFMGQVNQLRDHAQDLALDVFRNVTDRPFSDDQFLSVFRGLQRRLVSRDEAERILEVGREERRDIQRQVRERARDEPPKPTRFLAFDVHNRITAAARERRFLQRQSLEELGGSMLFSRN